MDRNLALFQHLALSPGDNLAHAALAMARLEYPTLDLSRYLDWFEKQGLSLASLGGATRSTWDRILILNDFFYTKAGFGPNSENYYDPRNSYVNDVIERRTGIPITMAIVYIELARHLNLDLQGVGFPGHFLVRSVQEAVLYVDVFQFGRILSRDDCARRFAEATGGDLPFTDAYLKRATKVEVLTRMLGNLRQIFAKQQSDRVLEILNWIIAIEPGMPPHYRDRGLLLAQMECSEAALKDLERYLELAPASVRDRRKIENLVATLRGRKTTVH